MTSPADMHDASAGGPHEGLSGAAARSAPTAPRTRSIAALGVGGTGIIVGTFLPWVNSGSVGRSVYQLADLAGRLGFAGQLPLAAMPIVPLACAAPVVLVVLGARRTGAIWGAIVALAVLCAAVAALTIGPHSGPVTIAWAGPAIAAASAAVLLVAAVLAIRWPGPMRRA